MAWLAWRSAHALVIMLESDDGVRELPPVAQGDAMSSIDKDLIRRIVRSHLGEVRKCYEEGLARDPTLKGRVVISFTIGKSGRVVTSTLRSSDLADATVGECIANTAIGWKFYENSSISVVVYYPFVLSPD